MSRRLRPILVGGGGTPSDRKGPPVKRTLFVIATIVALLAGACSSTDEQFRESLLDDGFSEEQADCVLDGLDAAGIDPADLTDQALGNDLPPEEALEVTAACFFGSAFEDMAERIADGDDISFDLDTSGSSSSGVDDYGDDPAMDALFDACQAGDGAACDELYWSSPLGSRYEDFGNTCGGRFVDSPPLSCEDALG